MDSSLPINQGIVNKNYDQTGFYSIRQGVVTLIGPVEPFATRIKMKSSDQEAI